MITVLLVPGLCVLAPAQTIYEVEPAVETSPIHLAGDYADDPAIWIHPDEPTQSVIIGTVKDVDQGGLYVYNLDGSTNQFVQCGQMNNVDLRYNVPLGSGSIDLVVSGDRSEDVLMLFRMNASNRKLEPIGARDLPIGLPGDAGYGFCMYHSDVNGKTFGFVGNKDGGVEQWEFFDTGSNLVDGVVVRTFDVGGQCEGMVADDELGHFYVAEENGDIWRYNAEPDGGTARISIATAAIGQPIVPDVEGLALYYAGSGGGGYLIASSQGEDSGSDPFVSTFAVFDRANSNAYIASFDIVASGSIDGVTGTDGIDICNVALNGVFSNGMFVAHDNSNDGENVNFKLTPWEHIAGAPSVPLTVSLDWNPRDVGNPDGDTDGDGLPNRWEKEFFGSSTIASPSGNSDGDAYSNLEEYRAGLNPIQKDSFTISVFTLDPDPVLEWSSVSGRLYCVEWRSNLLNHLPELIASNLTHGVYTDMLHSADQGFYRLRVEPALPDSAPE